MTMKDDLNKIIADLEAIKTTLGNSPAGSVDLTPVLTAVADVKTDTAAIKVDTDALVAETKPTA